MRTTESIVIAAARPAVFSAIERLDAYPDWLPLVHAAESAPGDSSDVGPAWFVELRAKVGPFARSKRLRMVRTEHVPEHLAVFSRVEVEGREHADWTLRAELADVPEGTELTMHLAYGGTLWTGGVLERVLDDQVRQGRAGLQRLLSGAPPTP